MVPEELSIAISSGIHTVLKTRQKLTIKGVHIPGNAMLRHLDVVIKPLSTTDEKNNHHFLILLQDQDEKQNTEQNLQVFNKEIHFNDCLADLESELKNTKDNLYATVEELEASNEELQSTNEELLSANEELQSTNEELQSLNEELSTVNTEYEEKIHQLTELHDDLDNYFRASHISQIFIDRQLIVRKFTPTSKKLINLIDSDIGRPIADISTNVIYADLIEDLNTVIRESTSIEKTLSTKENNSYQMKIIPYLRRDKIIDGAIITFADITNDLKKAEKDTQDKLVQQKEILNAVIDTQEAERKRIGESLHNGLGQILYTVKLKLEGIHPDTDPKKIKAIGDQAQALLLEAIKETRHLSSALMPVILEDYGLACAIDSICKKLKETLKVKCKIEGFETRLESQFEIAIYRIIQELSNNIIKHAKATTASIEVNNVAGLITILVKDNGLGFSTAEQGTGIGISSIKSRVKLLGGQLAITSKKNAGTAVQISFQL
jgi:signal transduction histidine kinase